MSEERRESVSIQASDAPAMIIPLIDYLCKENKCSPRSLGWHLWRRPNENMDLLHKVELCTTHLKPTDRNFIIEPDFISRKCANKILAFRGKFGVPVETFYYIRHRRRLLHADLPCIAVKVLGRNGTTTSHSFYPLEVIGVLMKGTEDDTKEYADQSISANLQQISL